MNFNETALILIDLQKESNFGLMQTDEVITNTKKLVEECRNAGIPIIYTRQINRADSIGLSKGEPLKQDGKPYYYDASTESIDIFDEIAPKQNDIVIDKNRWSAFYATNLDMILKSMGVENLIIGGLVTDGCVLTSVYDAYFRDYDIHLIEDICATSNEGAHMSSMLIMANWIYNLKIYKTDEFIKRLNGESAHFWTTEAADSLQFTPESMKQQFNKLNSQEGL